MKNNYKKIFKIFIVAFLLVLSLNIVNYDVYAAINSDYGDSGKQSVDLDEDKVVESSPITNYLGSFIFTVGVIIETLTSNLMTILTGDKVFPWADKVIFNTVPILDINFINPDSNSLLSTSGAYSVGIGEIVRNIYFTGLSMALGFLGIIIAVMAIKLAISTIASEKAKYKEAIVKWLTSLVLLFGMHFVLAFVFYLNEELVKVASKILEGVITENSTQLQTVINSKLNENKQEIVLNFCNKAIESAAWAEAYSWVTPIGWVSNGIQWLAGAISGDDQNAQKVSVAQANAEYLLTNYEITYAMINNSAIREYALSYIEGNSENNWLENLGASFSGSVAGLFGYSAASDELAWMRDNVEYIKNGISESTYNVGMQQVEEWEKLDPSTTEYKAAQLLRVVYTYAYQYGSGTFNSNSSVKEIVAELGEYFKTAAWYTDVEDGAWSPSSASIVGATLYTIFVVQSLSFFLAYIKRFFYVVVLSVIAPFVVIYDFFTKSVRI